MDGGTYKLMPYDWQGRAECLHTVYASTGALVDGAVLDAYFEQGVIVHLAPTGASPTGVWIESYVPISFIQLYFSPTEQGLRFDGALFPHDPTVTVAIGVSTPSRDHAGMTFIPMSALAQVQDLANASLGHPGTVRWQPIGCYIFFCKTPGVACRRVSVEEIVLAVRHRIWLYKAVERDAAHTLDAAVLERACSAATERLAVLDWLVVLFVSICSGQMYDSFRRNEVALFRRRLEVQACTPEARVCMLTCNGFVQSYTGAHAGDQVDFVEWACGQYHETLTARRGQLDRVALDTDDTHRSESIDLAIMFVGKEISSAMGIQEDA